MTSDDYCGFEKEKIAENPMLQLALDLSQIIDDGAPLNWWKHKFTAGCLLDGYKMERIGWDA